MKTFKIIKPLILFLVFFLLLQFSCDKKQELSQTKKQFNEDIIKANLDTLIEYCWNKKDLTKFKSISTENTSRKMNNITVATNQKEVEANMNVILTGFPDLIINLNDYYIIDNQVFMRWNLIGTNTGIYGEFPATGKKIKINGISNLHFNEEGKIYEEDVYYNELDLLQQLGYILTPPIVE